MSNLIPSGEAAIYLCKMGVWRKHSKDEIHSRVFQALDKNVDYFSQNIMGVPASHLDQEVFNHDAPFLKEAPFLSTLLKNPNHIGCHTLAEGEPFFAGTHEIEREAIRICAEDILHGEENSCDGYIAAGGTEANIQAVWIFRNYFQTQGIQPNEVSIICSQDTHYSVEKAANLLNINLIRVSVDHPNREWDLTDLEHKLESARNNGTKALVVILNMMTTMFGSVDHPEPILPLIRKSGMEYRVHIDGAYGGFYYPFTAEDRQLSFENEEVTSITLDAHKMAQAPYGTGMLLIRKGWMHHTQNGDAKYVKGDDFTLSGSRSGANAIAVWMILTAHGPYSWKEKTFILQKRTDWLCDQLGQLGIEYFRNPASNIITLNSKFVSAEVADEFGLVPDDHQHPKWYKIVIMEHVTIEKVKELLVHLEPVKDQN
jgi:glutamate/tyrosine decarboxylase-like PLP-dependent enzyme